MKKIRMCLAILGAMVALGLVTPAFALRDEPAGQQQEKQKKEQTFKGKVEAVDIAARTMTVDSKLIYIADNTKLTKNDKAIKLSDLKVGEDVHGTTHQTFDGKTEAITVKVGKEKEPERK